MTRPRLLISFSGGRTSGFMTKRVLDSLGDRYDIKVVFANTGLENEATLEFVHNCDVHFGFNTVWVEAVVHNGMRKTNGHRVVSFLTCSRNGEPFEADIRKYGIPNAQSPHCTRDLKRYPIESYLRSIGWEKNSYETAIGIRTDELRRVKEDSGRRIVYPLVDWFPADKQDVLDWWEDQPFDLQLQEHQGNCKTCWKKSFKKLVQLHKEDPSQFDFFERMEREFGRFGPEFAKYDDAPNRVFFRGRTSVAALRSMANSSDQARVNSAMHAYESGGCTESCEMYESTDA